MQSVCRNLGQRMLRNTGVSFAHVRQMSAEGGAKHTIKVVPREMRRQLRKERKKTSENVRPPMSNSTKVGIAGAVGLGVWFGVVDDETKKSVRSTLDKSFLGDAKRYIMVQIKEVAKPFTDPSREKLLPDWPIPGIPPDLPQFPTLIVDLEDTLVHSEWDRRHGWRHAKRPGVDKFLETLSRHYEVVIFSKQSAPVSESVVALLDKKRYAWHYLFRDATHFYNGAHVKDIENLNRDKKRVIIIDDDPAAYQLQPENAIPVTPYTDGKDRSDTEILDLIPFLQAVATENVQDIPALLNEFRDSDGVIRDLPSKYAARVQRIKAEQAAKKQSGLGGLLRGRMSSNMVPRPSTRN